MYMYMYIYIYMYMSTTQRTVQRAVSIVTVLKLSCCSFIASTRILLTMCVCVYVCMCTTDLWHIVTGYGYQITSWTKESGVVKDGHVVTLVVRQRLLCTVQISSCVL